MHLEWRRDGRVAREHAIDTFCRPFGCPPCICMSRWTGKSSCGKSMRRDRQLGYSNRPAKVHSRHGFSLSIGRYLPLNSATRGFSPMSSITSDLPQGFGTSSSLELVLSPCAGVGVVPAPYHLDTWPFLGLTTIPCNICSFAVRVLSRSDSGTEQCGDRESQRWGLCIELNAGSWAGSCRAFWESL